MTTINDVLNRIENLIAAGKGEVYGICGHVVWLPRECWLGFWLNSDYTRGNTATPDYLVRPGVNIPWTKEGQFWYDTRWVELAEFEKEFGKVVAIRMTYIRNTEDGNFLSMNRIYTDDFVVWIQNDDIGENLCSLPRNPPTF